MSDGAIILGPKGAGWTCFDCTLNFESWDAAREHFGLAPGSEPACILSGKANDPGPGSHFHEAPAARAFFERHLWPAGPRCPHCGDDVGGMAFGGGPYHCKTCNKVFSLLSGTIFSGTHLEPHLWLRAIRAVALDPHIETATIQAIFECTFNPAHRMKRVLVAALQEVREGDPIQAMAAELSQTYEYSGAGGGWRCLCCSETFSAWNDAAAHFRFRAKEAPACCTPGHRGLSNLDGVELATFAD